MPHMYKEVVRNCTVKGVGHHHLQQPPDWCCWSLRSTPRRP